ncbi:MAG: 3-phosphoglycerate dehydrogenase [Spirochaetaceae bacterium]|jgi:D-3-phosphoglycerate dehydrogenase|nr:3-phosphoglycerate dehydrogenase [Spirochaetaceae bacterium]
MFKILTMNNIAAEGLALFPGERYLAGPDVRDPDAILIRSASLFDYRFSPSTLAVARAGAGVNNIPVEMCSEQGIVVFNTPGANANAVKEMALAALFLASRKIIESVQWAKTLTGSACLPDSLNALIENNKAGYAGPELTGKTLGVVGLGAIGVMVANDAQALGMNVTGFDPYISVDAAWKLSRNVKKAESLESLLAESDYVTIHIPYSESTRGLFGAEKIRRMKKGARLINLARGGLAQETDIIAALDSGHLALYLTDFPTPELLAHPKVICTPHLGASTPEAEINCAVMAVRQIMDFLETGAIKNSVNYPRCSLANQRRHRLLVANRNIPNMVGQMTTLIAGNGINITGLVNHHYGDYAYNIIDTEEKVPEPALNELRQINGIIRVRTIESAESQTERVLPEDR